MLSQKEHEQKRIALMNGAVLAVAHKGLENISTRDISEYCHVNESYIYRYFDSKEDLLSKTFATVDRQFQSVILENFPVLKYESLDYEMRCELLWKHCWDHILTKPDSLTFYVRYYYSSSYQHYARAEHLLLYRPVLQKMADAFPDSIDVANFMHFILDSLLGMAMNCVVNPPEDRDAVAHANFQMVFSVVIACIKKDRYLKKLDKPGA